MLMSPAYVDVGASVLVRAMVSVVGIACAVNHIF